jgi:hypothetical protein
MKLLRYEINIRGGGKMRSVGLATSVVVLVVLAACAAVTEPGRSKDVKVDDLKANGKRLSAEEVKALMVGSTMEGVTLDRAIPYKLRATDDGRYTGESGTGNRFTGKWNVNDKGQICTYTDQRAGGGDPCADYYVMGGKYFAITPSGAVMERRFTK